MKKKTKSSVKINNLILVLVFLFFIALIARLSQLALSSEVDGKNLKQFATNRTTANETIYAKRGTIYDGSGEVLAQNVYSYTVIAYLEESRGEGHYVKDKEYTAKQLATVLDIDESKILSLLQKDAYQTEFGSKGRGLTELTKDKIVVLGLAGIDFMETQKRYYPKGDFLSYTLGYAKSLDDGTIVGEMGLESLFDKELTGTNGYRQYQKDLRGYKIANTKEIVKEAKDGDDIYLTIDYNIQFFIDQALRNAEDKYHFQEMNIVVADAKTGAILGMASSPSFDPNLRNVKKYLDPNVSVSVEPGSTMKIYSYMATMEAGKYNGNATYKSGVYVTKDGTAIGDWNRDGWGTISFDKGFALSSNVGVVNLIKDYINKNTLMNYYKKLGFGQKTGIDLAKESAGKINFKYETEVYNAGFGQGIMTTAMQNIQALTSIANDGVLLKPYIVEKVVDSNGKVVKSNKRTEIERVASKDTTDKMKDLMEKVVQIGTGSVYKMDGYNLIAKTGTAQISSTNGTGYLTGASDVIRGFAGMYPKDDPQIIIYATLTKPSPNSPTPLAKAVKELIANISKYKNIFNDQEEKVVATKYTLNSYINKSVDQIKNTLDSNGVTSIIIGDGNKIIKQYPNKGEIVTANEKVYLLTNGTNITMPSINGWSTNEVKNLLKFLGIKYTINGSGYVTSQSIKAGTIITKEMELVVECNPKFN